jgi:hypothetical protein
MFENILTFGFQPLWLQNLPHHVKICVFSLVGLHLVIIIGAIIFGVRASKSEGSKGYQPAFSGDIKTKNQ